MIRDHKGNVDKEANKQKDSQIPYIDVDSTHHDTRGNDCQCQRMSRIFLNHWYLTDVARLELSRAFQSDVDFDSPSEGQSVLQSLLKAINEELEIEPGDVSGCIKYNTGREATLIFYDTIPGGAGYVRRLLTEEGDVIRQLFKKPTR